MWWNGTAWATAPSPSDVSATSDTASSLDDSERDDDPGRRRDRVHALLAGTVTLGAIVVVALIVAALRSDDGNTTAFVGVGQQSAPTIDPVALERQACMQNAFEAIDSAFSRARDASGADRDNSALNLDGDGSWRDYGESLQAVDTSTCPADFRTTMIEFSNAWIDYGREWSNASKRLSFDNMSDEDTTRHSQRINQARGLLEDIAFDHGANVDRATYSIG